MMRKKKKILGAGSHLVRALSFDQPRPISISYFVIFASSLSNSFCNLL